MQKTLRLLASKILLALAFLLPLAGFHQPPDADFGPEKTPGDFDIEKEIASYPKDYFRSPVDSDLKLTGTFGELRPDHFHSGIDIKSKTGGIGQPVFSAADGFVDRIRVQTGGYGNVIYLKHPNGYGTVYAHLDRFAPELERYVRENQYQKEQFEVDLKPKDGQFRFRAGEEIGKLGNSGGSTGPHLHFEIRSTTTDKALNPLLFGLPVPDRVPPEIRDMKVYFLNENREVLQSKPLPVVRRKDGSYGLRGGDTLRLGAWRVGFGVKTYDEMSGFANDNGIYALSLQADDASAYLWRMNELDFDETRYHNAHIDYPAKRKQGAYFHRCFLLPGNRLGNYARTENAGAVALFAEKPVKIAIKALDANGNSAEITFFAIRDDDNMEASPNAPYQYVLPFDAESRIEAKDFSMWVPKNCFYETVFLRYQTSPEESRGIFSPVHHVGEEATPVHRYFEIALKPGSLPDSLRPKAIVAKCHDGPSVNCGGTWRDGFLSTKIREFGDYCIMADTEAPSIAPVVFDGDMHRKGSMSFRIRDNFGIGGSADGLSFRGTVDGAWVLFEYDRKRERLTHTFDGHIAPGPHALRLSVTDDRGNEAVFEREFSR